MSYWKWFICCGCVQTAVDLLQLVKQPRHKDVKKWSAPARDGREIISICFLVVFISWGALLLEGWLFFRKRQLIKIRRRDGAWSCNLAGRKGAEEHTSFLKSCRILIRKCTEHAEDCKKLIRLSTRHAFNQGEFSGGDSDHVSLQLFMLTLSRWKWGLLRNLLLMLKLGFVPQQALSSI